MEDRQHQDEIPEVGTSADGATPGVGRRGLLGAAGGALLAGGLLGAAGMRAADSRGGTAGEGSADPLAQSHPLRGEHQSGITTAAQDYLFTAAFDVSTSDLEDLRTLMADWSVAAEQMTAG